VQRALDAVHGVDLNPYAVAIARFRLLLAAWQGCGVSSLANAPAFRLNLACGDSLLHGSTKAVQGSLGFPGMEHHYQPEDAEELERLLRPGAYHAVVANPPYITPKDRGLNEKYRERYPRVCYRQYSLAVPFMQRIFDLACEGGFTGQITANSFMKREFGKKLIQEFFPRIDLTHVIDTSGAYIPGHGTPTVILFGRNRRPIGSKIRTVMSIRGEPTTPDEPSQGVVWSAIMGQIDRAGSQSEFVSVADSPRENFHKHPWSIGGGGAAELKEVLDQTGLRTLEVESEEIGFGAVTRADEAYVVSDRVALRNRIPSRHIRPLISGDAVRDWLITDPETAIWPYDPTSLAPIDDQAVLRFLWPYRLDLSDRSAYGQTQIERGLHWYEYSMFFQERFRTPLSLTFACVATHNQVVLDRGGKVFNRHAPIIKLPATATEEDHLALLGLLNSSTACFWMKQVCMPKGGHGIGRGIQDEAWEGRMEFDGTKLNSFPLSAGRPLALARQLDALARDLAEQTPARLLARLQEDLPQSRKGAKKILCAFAALREVYASLRGRMISLQEDLDWQCYRLYGLLDEVTVHVPRLADPVVMLFPRGRRV
jgi:hypothetical protein